jgi:hypothetical protein
VCVCVCTRACVRACVWMRIQTSINAWNNLSLTNNQIWHWLRHISMWSTTQIAKSFLLLCSNCNPIPRWLRWSSGLRAGLWFPSWIWSSNPAEAVGFFLCKKSSAGLPLEGKLNNRSHVPTLRHLKEPLSRGVLRADSEIPSTAPSFTSRGLSRCLVRWRLWRWMRELLPRGRIQ